jgi:transposase
MSAIHPDWVLAQKRKGTAIHCIKGYYYLYEVSSQWDPVKKRPRRITGKLIGRITPEGLTPSGQRQPRQSSAQQERLSQLTVKEYGISHFIQTSLKGYLDKLAKHFPGEWQALAALAYCRLVHQSAIKQMPFHIGHSYLSEVFGPLPLTDKNISLLLRDIGRQRERVSGFMKQSLTSGEHLLLDMTNIPSKSGQIALSKSGYNSNWDFEPQFNLMYIYSTNLQAPVFYRLVPGNIREVTALRLTALESGARQCVLVADKGFYSLANIEQLEADHLHYIIPLRRDNSFINYQLSEENAMKTQANFFSFEKRFIWHTSYMVPQTERRMFLFLDDTLKNKEQFDYLSRIEAKCEGYSLEKFHLKKQVFGTIAIISDLKDKTPEEIYTAYKTRMSIETVFDAMKTVLEADRTYMQQEEVLQGWMFVNHIALQWYYHLYHILVQAKQIKKYSVKDMLNHLQEIRMVKIDGQWHRAEIVKASQKLLDKINLPIA